MVKKNKNWLINTLSNLDLNKSSVREEVCRQIYLQKGIFSAKQIITRAKLGKVSVYRNLELLEKLNLIRPAINVKGEQFYEKNNNDNHHHHIICSNCLKTSCVKCSEPKIKTKEKFQNINHLLIFTGICDTCAKSN